MPAHLASASSGFAWLASGDGLVDDHDHGQGDGYGDGNGYVPRGIEP